MSISSRTRRAVAALTTVTALAAPAIIAPATASAQVGSLDHLGRPNAETLKVIEDAATNPNTPPRVGELLVKLVGFFRGEEGKGVPMPTDAPRFTQFAWPTVADRCISGQNRAVGTAMAVPGPAHLPLPGVAAGELEFVFTAIGTGTVAEQQNTAMRVHWVNVNNGKRGVTQLSYKGINPEGPGTINGTAQTGSGTVLAFLEGGVTTNEGDAGAVNCNFLPTAGVFQVG